MLLYCYWNTPYSQYRWEMNYDNDLIRAYQSLRKPADRIACFQTIRALFLNLVPDHIRANNDDDQIIWRLLQLRKSRKLPAIRKEH
jgi:hypothetical protein